MKINGNLVMVYLDRLVWLRSLHPKYYTKPGNTRSIFYIILVLDQFPRTRLREPPCYN